MTDKRLAIPNDNLTYSFHSEMSPRWTVDPGTRLDIRCPDNMGGQIRSEEDVVDELDMDQINGAVGPIAVSGADPGDILVFEIEDIKLTQDWGYMFLIPGLGLLGDRITRPKTKIVPFKDSRADYRGIALDLMPFIGVIGVAPAEGEFGNILPGDHGGNLDTNDIRAGSRLYLPIRVTGGLFALGDPKAVMGNGETSGSGINAPIQVLGRIDLIKNQGSIGRPLVETADMWQTIASAKTLEEACALAVDDMTSLVMWSQGWPWEDAHMFLGAAANLTVSQAVNPLMTVRVGVPKRYLKVPLLEHMPNVLGAEND